MLLFPSSSMRASANTPAETTGACVARFPVAGSLPRYNGGSASASCFSRPARRLLAFSPAWSLNRLTRPFDARVLQSISLPPRTALAATNRSDSCCAGFAPARRKRLSTAHVARLHLGASGTACWPVVHDITASEFGLPSAAIRLRMWHPIAASLPCALLFLAFSFPPSPDLYRKNPFSTRACR